jgi:hypothetical protein
MQTADEGVLSEEALLVIVLHEAEYSLLIAVVGKQVFVVKQLVDRYYPFVRR